ncbi:hypothetical protein AVEN_134350-1 [Araneus ventricosus]|uniref:Uncharacterized protein n=1 Tax=Araneus ventricosus TaxID=182803 RepID=A0A4Y2J758_ARAVE|nr:hypothetical protein AVEN_134350-1 [Araneus ventricosus]
MRENHGVWGIYEILKGKAYTSPANFILKADNIAEYTEPNRNMGEFENSTKDIQAGVLKYFSTLPRNSTLELNPISDVEEFVLWLGWEIHLRVSSTEKCDVSQPATWGVPE